MLRTIETLIALEKVKPPHDQEYIIYTYILPESPQPDQPVGYFIALEVCPENKVKERVERIIRVSDYSDIYACRLCEWFSLGDPKGEKKSSIEIRDNLKEYAELEDTRKEKIRQERERVSQEIRQELVDIDDPDKIESYYYDWFCLVLNKQHLESLEKEIASLRQANQKRFLGLQEKAKKHPDYRHKWQQVLLERLSRRGEKSQAEYVIQEAKEICRQHNVDI